MFVFAGGRGVVEAKGHGEECVNVLGAELPAIRWRQCLEQSLSGVVQAVRGEWSVS